MIIIVGAWESRCPGPGMGLFFRVRQTDEVADSESPEWSAAEGRHELEAFVAFNESSAFVLPT